MSFFCFSVWSKRYEEAGRARSHLSGLTLFHSIAPLSFPSISSELNVHIPKALMPTIALLHLAKLQSRANGNSKVNTRKNQMCPLVSALLPSEANLGVTQNNLWRRGLRRGGVARVSNL